LPAVTDFISAPFYDLFHEDWYVPKVGIADTSSARGTPVASGGPAHLHGPITVSSAARQAGRANLICYGTK